MPLIHIKSLPLEQSRDMGSMLQGISEDFARDLHMASEHITVTWEYFQPGHYAIAGLTAEQQPVTSHPVLVDLLVSDFNSERTIEYMLHCVAQAIAQHAGLPSNNVFINCRCAHPGKVFDEGEIVR